MSENGLEKVAERRLGTHLKRGKKMRQNARHVEITRASNELGNMMAPTKIVKRKTIMLKSNIDTITARLLGQKLKFKLFTKTDSQKYRPDQLELVAINKYYDQYRVVSGKYAIDYCKSFVFTINVAENAQEITIFDKRFKPEHSNEASNAQKFIKLDCTEHFHYEDRASFVLDKMGHEADLEQLRFAQFKKQADDKTAKSIINVPDVKNSSEEVNLLRSKIVKRPVDVGEIVKEVFEVNERALIYCPMYQLTFRNSKTKKEIAVKIDAIEGKMFSSEAIETKTKKPMKLPVELQSDILSHVEFEPIKGEPQLQEAEDIFNIRNAAKQKDNDLNVIKASLGFPAKVAGEVFHVGDNITAIVGDLEIPSGTTVLDTIVVKGNLKTGTSCQLLGKVKALKDVVIGENTSIKGKVVSGRNVTIGKNSIIHGSVESEGDVKINKRATIKGGLSSKSSVKLDKFAKVLGTINATKGISVMN